MAERSIEDSPSLIDEEEEEAEKDLDEFNKFTSTLDQFNTVIPETVTRYYMRQCALQSDDDRCVKLFSVAVQKFMSEIINDCFQVQKLREKSTNRAAANIQPAVTEGGTATTDQIVNAAGTKKPPSSNNTLTLHDLTHVLDEYDINVKKTFYYT